MANIKIYQSVNAHEDHITFEISKMETIFTKRNGKQDTPHRHNYFTVLIINHANGVHKIDFNSYPLSSNQIYFVAPGQVHQVIEHEKSYGYVMTFSNQFLVQNSIPLSFIESLNLFQDYGQSPPLLPNREQFEVIQNYAENIFSIFKRDAPMKILSIGSFLKLLLIECNNICTINPIESTIDNSGTELIRKFKKYVEKEYKQEHSTTYYANKLNITSDHLNRTFKARIGKTAKEYIQSRIITEAKRLLYFTNASNKEIGYELGFNEPANFSAFFKKHTHLSPSRFKKTEINP